MLRLSVEVSNEPVESVLKAVAPYKSDWRDQVLILNTASNWLRACNDAEWCPVLSESSPIRIDFEIDGARSLLSSFVQKP